MYRRMNITAVGYDSVTKLEAEHDWWIELGDQILTIESNRGLSAIVHSICPDTSLVIILKQKFCGGQDNRQDLDMKNHRILMREYGYIILQAIDKASYDNLINQVENMMSYKIVPMTEPGLILIRSNDNMQVMNQRGSESAWITNLVNNIDETELFNDVSSLASFNRYTLGSGITAARNWIVNEIRKLGIPASAITEQSFPVQTVLAYNIIVKLEGATKKDDWIIFGAHYDSTSQSPSSSAPGAEDNASGSSGVLNILKAFVKYPPQKGTLFFMWYSGEEQGLYGSKFNANSIINAGDKNKVKAVYTHDMIGYYSNRYGVLLETYREYQTTLLADYPTAKSTYLPSSSLGISYDYNPFGSDHVSYLEKGMPALLAIDQNWSTYPNYHRTTDLPSAIKRDILRDITKLEIAVAGMKIEAL